MDCGVSSFVCGAATGAEISGHGGGEGVMPMIETQQLIYVLCHSYTVNKDDPDFEETNMKNLYYSFSRQKCADQISYYKTLPGFCEFPDGFEVLHIKLEELYSETGFFRW